MKIIFQKLQTDMVAICLEYVENKVNEIFIYWSYEPEIYLKRKLLEGNRVIPSRSFILF